MSSPHSHNEEGKGYSPHMRGVALGILVMGISLAAVIILWTTFGYLGPNFSTQVMERQQERLHEQYGLPPLPELSPETLQVPPSLRNVAQEGGGGEAAQTGAQTTGGNQTGAQTTGGNQTGAQTTGGDAATGGAAGEGGAGPTINILEGASIQGSPDYDPDELTASAGAEVTVVNQDTLPHT
ncbi:MAG TPA: hypothetical protein VFQ47_00090, partial [Nitrososphaera sp.]|nr:hypothetical protein [Nitrososphaera sp.]